MLDNITIAVDFDGTLSLGHFPQCHPTLLNKPLIAYLEQLQQQDNVELVLWTCRDGDDLQQALSLLAAHTSLNFVAINDNSPSVKLVCGNPRKIVADVYIDDRSCNPASINEVIQFIQKCSE